MDIARYYIDGPGEVLIVATDFDAATPDATKIIASITCKSASISAGATLEDVTGGRSLFPQRRFPTERTASVEFSDCEMDWRYNQLVTGEATTVGAATVWAFGTDGRVTVPSSSPYTVKLPNEPLTDTMTIYNPSTGVAVKPAATAAEGTPSLADDTLTFVAADAGKVFELMYAYTSAATSKQTSLKIDSLPKTVKVIHKQPTWNQDNIQTGTQYIEFFKMQPSPEFNEDYQERSAYAPTITFDLVDPKRPDMKVYDRTWVPVS